MDRRPPLTIPLIAGMALLAMLLSAQEPDVPDFSKGMPDVQLERTEKRNGQETFHFQTALSAREFSTTLGKFLGPGWGKRKLDREEMTHAADLGRTSNAEVNLAVFENTGMPEVEIRVIHLKYKGENPGFGVEIAVVREGED